MEDEQGAKRPAVDLQPAILEARAERARPLQREQQRKELLRLMQVWGCLYALEHLQTPNIEVRRDLERLEAVVFVKKSSIEVEMSRERVQQHKAEVWRQIEAVVDLIGRPEVAARKPGEG